jgi:hypothetical protein
MPTTQDLLNDKLISNDDFTGTDIRPAQVVIDHSGHVSFEGS